MEDQAENVDDLICTFDSYSNTTMDTLAMFIFGWILVAFGLLWLGKFLYAKFLENRNKKSATEIVSKPKITEVISKDDLALTSNSASVTNDLEKSIEKPLVSLKKSSSLPKSKGGAVPSTPTARRRLTRQSPAPADLKKTRYIPAPMCTGADNVSVLWINDVFQWLYSDMVIVNELLQVWIQSLNEFCTRSDIEQGIGIEFVRILPETHPPSLTNLFCECDSKDDVVLTCDCEATPAFQLKCTRKKGDKLETSHYRVNVNRLRARLNIYLISEKLQADLKCDGWPEIKIALAPVGNIKNNLDESQLQDVVSEIVTAALRSTEFHLNLAQYASCPRLIRHIEVLNTNRSLPLHYDSMLSGYTSSINHMSTNRIPSDKRLLVKIIRATQLGGNLGCTEPYCVIEMDEPPQKYQTSFQKNTDSPYWDEHFLFEISSNTQELLLEIYDHSKKPPRFLGLGIVGVEELLINPSQRQTISLQSRPYESDQVSGTLTAEFLFIEGADIPIVGSHPYKIKETISPSPSSGRLSPNPVFRNDRLTNGDHFVDGDYRRPSSFNPNTNTLVVHSMQRQPSQRLVKVELSEGSWKEVERIEKSLNDDIAREELQEKLDELSNGNGNIGNGNTTVTDEEKGPASLQQSPYSQYHQTQIPNESLEYRGRSRKRRDFFGTIKRRLGRSKGRSKSAGPGDEDFGREDSLNRSISADRGRGESYKLTVPGGRPEETSRRSSLSEASGLSSTSTRTYINEASTLVLETLENGIKKHYLVPLSLAQKSKWKKKGTKLHIFNDHTFIAKHITGGTVCQVCCKTIARRIGKQGYECRDCLLKCHKQCHVKVNDNCPTSTIHNIELSYIQNPLTDKNIRML
ncbi:uncharacterized protein [Onthophagus taurus]|uniref:uncharacterized protein n=1 Tax=Onthophagus taurus TaxID=166361 RepID=UPI0039BE8574